MKRPSNPRRNLSKIVLAQLHARPGLPPSFPQGSKTLGCDSIQMVADRPGLVGRCRVGIIAELIGVRILGLLSLGQGQDSMNIPVLFPAADNYDQVHRIKLGDEIQGAEIAPIDLAYTSVSEQSGHRALRRRGYRPRCYRCLHSWCRSQRFSRRRTGHAAVLTVQA